MAGRAPGQDGPREDPECYNCGVKGHFAVACPEEVRKVPAGLEAFRQRKAASQTKGSGGGGKGGNSMVITRYGPPPGVLPPSLPYAPASLPPPPAPPPPAPPVLYAPPPAPPPVPGPWQYPPAAPVGYPTPGYAPGPPPPPTYDAYGYPQPSYGPPPPPQPGPPGPPAAPQYYQPYPPQPQPYYPPAPQPYAPAPYPPPIPHPQVVPPPPSAYPQGPPSLPPYPPAPYEIAPAYPLPPFPPESARDYPHSGRGRSHNRGGKGRDRDRDRDRGRGRDRDRDRDRKQNRKDPPRHTHASATSTDKPKSDQRRSAPEPDTPTSSADAKGPKGKEKLKEDPDDDFQWELRAAFTEVSTKPADPVGTPLPAEYSDAPTIPPAFNAKAIKSEFFTPDNCDEFCLSIRDSKTWHIVKRDPAFSCWPGMTRRRFPNTRHEYFTYRTRSTPYAGELVVEADIERTPPPQYKRSPLHIPTGPSAGLLGKHGRDRINGNDEPHSKRFRSSQFHSSSPGAYGRHREGSEHNHRTASDHDRRPLNGRAEHRRPNGSPFDPRARHDSGYHSNNSSDRQYGGYNGSRPSRDARDTSFSQSPPPPSRGLPRYERGRRSESPRGAERDRVRKAPSRPRSPASSRSRSSSPLDEFEMQMLGMAPVEPPSDKEKKGTLADAKIKRRQVVKVDEAFRFSVLNNPDSRRW